MGTLGQFKNAFGEGIRPNLFKVEAQGGFSLTSDESVLIKAAALPSASLGTINIPFRGREIKRAGDRTFADWSITVLADENKAIYEKFVEWSNGFVALNDTDRGAPYAQWTVVPVKPDGSGNAGQVITLVDCWPTEVGTIDLSYDTTDQIAEFTVTIAFDHWKVGSGNS